MTVKTVTVGEIGTNCYLVSNGENLYVIDPGAESARLIAAIDRIEFKNIEILLTHAHFDHIGAAGELCRKYDIPAVKLRTPDRELYLSRENSMMPYFPPVEDLPPVEELVSCGDYQVLPMPGHSPGGSGILFADETGKNLFIGDSVFASSIGRTDLYGGSYEQLIASIKREILTLDDDVKLYPGHGPATSVGRERQNNPFFR